MLVRTLQGSPKVATFNSYILVVEDYGLETVQEYMYHIRVNAEMSVRNLLRDVVKRAGTNFLSATDYLDDGSPVRTFLRLSRRPCWSISSLFCR